MIRVCRTHIPLAPAMRPCKAVGRLEYFITRMMRGAELSSERNDTWGWINLVGIISLVPHGQTMLWNSLSTELFYYTVHLPKTLHGHKLFTLFGVPSPIQQPLRCCHNIMKGIYRVCKAGHVL